MSADRRIEVTGILPAPFEWCLVDGGGVDIEDGSTDGGSKGGRFEVESLLMAKYPITQAQYQVFVEAVNGYRDEQWWGFSDHASQWRKDNPETSTIRFEGDDLPRTKVSWYEAMAFCQWLSFKSGKGITLPSEQQWQRAAIGDTGWIYPWGDKIDSTQCNYHGSKIGQPTPVTKYEEGASPYGVYDMSGNVWEWTLTDWETGRGDALGKDSRRVVRGGSWNAHGLFSRAVYRNDYHPNFRSFNLGIRLVLSAGVLNN